MAVPTGFEPAIFCVTGRRDRPLHHGTMVAGAGFEPTTFGLWAQRATELLHPAIINIIGGGKGIRTPAPLSRPLGFQDRSLQPDLGIPPLYIGASDRTWTDMSFYTRRILSPVRLPIPPLRHLFFALTSSLYNKKN